jgi:signal peptidase I
MTDITLQASPTRSVWREYADIAVTLAVALVVATILRIVAFQPFTIPSSSMEPGLVTGDYIVVSKYAYGWSAASLPGGAPTQEGRFLQRQPNRGDVVVFRLPRNPDEVWIKRVIGLPGDQVQMRGGVVFVNGLALSQTRLGATRDHDAPTRIVEQVAETLPGGKRYVTYDGGADLPGDDTEVYRMPAGRYLVMGDNRDNSLDGRWPSTVGVGLLPAQNIVGRAEIIACSWKPGASLLKPWTWMNLHWDRFLVPIR